MNRPGRGAGNRLLGFLLPATALLCACSTAGQRSLPADARAVLQAQLSHGIGESPFDSPLVHDSVPAELIVRARPCAPIAVLRQLARDTAHAGRLLEELRAGGLLVFREDRACTTFPVLVGAEQAAYAQVTREVARNIHATLSSDLVALMRTVEERGWKEWQYHFLWSQLFDSQFAWTEMTQRSLVPPLAQLIAWVIYPAHPYRSGTNYYPDSELRDHWLLVSWRGNAANTVGLVGEIWEILHGAGVEGRALSGAQRERLAQLDLIDDRGQLRLPILRDGDPLVELLRALAVRHVGLLEYQLPVDSLMVLTRADRRTTFAMAYHDVSWGIAEELVRSGRIEMPAALRPGDHSPTPSMRGVAAVVPTYPPFVELIRRAIERSAER